MSITGKITNLFADKAMTIPAFPRTKVKAVSDDNGVGLDAILNNMVHAEEFDSEATMTPLNADTFNGYTVDALLNKIYADSLLNKNYVDAFLNKIYPVGSIYISVNSASPATLFGGTWEQIQDTFLLAAGSTYAAGSTGGEAKHTLTVSEMPSHDHNLTVVSPDETSGGKSTSQVQYGYDSSQNTSYTNGNAMGSTGGSQPHNNMPPYMAVFMWKRTA